MKNRSYIFIVTLSILILCSCSYTNNDRSVQSTEDTTKRISTKTGYVTGLKQEGTLVFLGLPYAEPPIGNLRWMPPRALKEENKEVLATSFPNRCFGAPYVADLGNREIPGDFCEDCLYLNVYTPAADEQKRPVLFWIHGGAFIQGSANEYSGRALAAENDVVVVMINYRLGPFGFLDLSSLGEVYEGSASLGIQDQVAALKWVKENIQYYGGDANNVTIFGESAGGAAVLALLATPSAKGLFHKAFASSPGEITGKPVDNIVSLENEFGLKGDSLLDKIKSSSPEDLIRLQSEGKIIAGGAIDGKIVIMTPSQAILSSLNGQIPIIAGSNKDEGTLLNKTIPKEAYEALTYVYGTTVANGDPSEYIKYLDELIPGKSHDKKMERVWYDYFRSSATRAAFSATQSGAGGWNYLFELPGNTPLRVAHSSDLAFIFNTLNNPDEGSFPVFHENNEVNREFARKWSKILAQFAKTGNPNTEGFPEWPQFNTPTYPTLITDSNIRVINNLDGEKLRKIYKIP